MLPETYIKAALATFAQKEAAQYGGIDNMLAVCFVIRNRMDAGWFGGDWLLAMEKAGDVAANSEAPEPQPFNLRETRYRKFLERIDAIFDGTELDVMTEGALYYGELNKPLRPWFVEHITEDIENHRHVATVGPVWFFL